jgi:hypothetical protein
MRPDAGRKQSTCTVTHHTTPHLLCRVCRLLCNALLHCSGGGGGGHVAHLMSDTSLCLDISMCSLAVLTHNHLLCCAPVLHAAGPA